MPFAAAFVLGDRCETKQLVSSLLAKDTFLIIQVNEMCTPVRHVAWVARPVNLQNGMTLYDVDIE